MQTPTADFPYYDTAGAGAAVGVTDARIRQMIGKGEIKAHPTGRRGYAIPISEVERLKRESEEASEKPRRGRPRGGSTQ